MASPPVRTGWLSLLDCDGKLFLFLNHLFATPLVSWFFGQVTHLGNGWMQVFIVTPLMFFFSREKFKSHFAAIFLTTLISGFAVTVLKVTVDRPRPMEYYADSGETVYTPGRLPVSRSFPSGHTQTAFATAGYLSFLYPPLAALFLGLATLVGASRIALGVHFPLDVLAGAMIGLGFAFMGYRLNTKRLSNRR